MNVEEFKKSFYHSKEWRTIRRQVLYRDNNICQICGKIVGKYPNVDHIQEINEYNYKDTNITLNIDNLQTLCVPCHNKKTKTDKLESVNILKKGTLDVDYDKRIDWSK